jgi:hypothetical protein
MLEPVKERVSKLRDEIAEMRGSKSYMETADHERRRQRLQEILEELLSLTEWKQP